MQEHHIKMITQLNNEVKEVALDILDFPLDMRDTMFPFWHAVPLHRKHPRLEDYSFTYPKWYNHSEHFLKLLEHPVHTKRLPTKVVALEAKERCIQVPVKGIVQIFSLNKKHSSVVVGKEKHNLEQTLDIPSYEQFDWKKHHITNNALYCDTGFCIGNMFFHSIHAAIGAKILYVKYD